MKKLSVAIVAYNEEKHLTDCLKSVDWAAEIIVVEGKSQDKTAEIAKNAGAKVYSVENQPLMKKMMNQAFSKCTSEWILQLDADERVSEQLKNEILQTISINPAHAAFQIPRKNLMFGKWIEHSGWYPDFQTRLFRNGKGKYLAKNVHEELEVQGSVGNLDNPIMHLNWESVSQFILRLDSYTSYEAGKWITDGKKIVWTDAIRFPFSEFLSRFFDRQAYKDGLHGLVLSILMAMYWELVFVKIWEKEGFWPHGDKNFIWEVANQAPDIKRQWNHWLMTDEQNPIVKSLRKVKNRLSL